MEEQAAELMHVQRVPLKCFDVKEERREGLPLRFLAVQDCIYFSETSEQVLA